VPRDSPTASEKTLMKRMVEKFKSTQSLHIVWVPAKRQARVLRTLHAPRAPSVLIIKAKANTKKDIRVAFASSFDEAAIGAALERAIGGDLPMTGFPVSTVIFH
jgi:hypothetical protein